MRSTVAVVHPYWDFWESSVAGDFRADRHRLLDRAAAIIAEHHDVAVSAIIGSQAEAVQVAEELTEVDALVVVSTMAAPPATASAFLDAVPGLPIVIWALHEERAFPSRFTHSDITTRGATVGGPMVASALARSGRPYDVALTHMEDPRRALDAIRCAAAAGRIKGSRILRIGPVMPGYTSVDATDEQLAGLGISSVTVAPEVVRDRAAAVGPDRLRDIESGIRAEFDVDRSVSALALERSMRVEAVVSDLMDETRTSLGAFNCHIPALRFGSDVGVAPCLALGRITTAGRPWTCAGDVVTSVAMLTVQALGHPSLYHEVEAVDWDADEVILANTGEHDLRLCGPNRPRLVPDVWYEDDPVVSVCAEFTLPPSAASLVGFVVVDGPRWVVAEGSFTGTEAPGTGTPNAGFRFASGPVADAWPAWARAGVTHHSAATNAHVAADLTRIAQHLGGEVISV